MLYTLVVDKLKTLMVFHDFILMVLKLNYNAILIKVIGGNHFKHLSLLLQTFVAR